MLLGRLLLELVIARVCVRPSASLLPLLPAKSASPACLLGMPSVFKPLAASATADVSSPRGAWMVAAASGPGRPRRSSSCARSAPRSEARARRLSRPRWAASGPRAVGRRTTPTRSSSWSWGSLRGSPTPPISPEASPHNNYPPEAVRRPLRGPLDGTGAVNAHMYSSEPTSVTPLPSLARGNKALQRLEELPGRAKYERCVTPSSRGRTYAKKRQPQRRAWQ